MSEPSSIALSVVVPLAADEDAWRDLAPDLHGLPQGSEIIFVGARSALAEDDLALAKLRECFPVQWLTSEPGRGRQLNVGSRAANNPYLWFLHADSRLEDKAIPELILNLKKFPQGVHYFQLRFQNDGPNLTVLNSLATSFRANVLGMPFGDQGFCIQKSLFTDLGGYAEHLKFGEDHAFVWNAKRNNLKLRSVRASIYTSARKYRQRGWLRVTTHHLVLTYWQAFTELRVSLRGTRG